MRPDAKHMAVVVRRAVPRDLELVLTVLADARAGQERQGLPPSWRALPRAAAAASIARGETYVVQRAGDTLGTFALEDTDAAVWPDSEAVGAVHLHRLAIDPHQQGLGIGSFAVDWAARTAAAQGRSLLRLDAVAANTRLCTWYERLGFTAKGEVLLPGWVRASMRFEREVTRPMGL
ncbi:GNAT family N-acetyltransferase [Streptomyces sp. 130]|nr:GNAT family N-acetyltransferase [Streptomyces sp. 130]